MLLVVAALHEEAAALLSVLQRDAEHIVDGLPHLACFSYDINTVQRAVPTFAVFEMHVCGSKIRIGVLITGAGKVASASAVSTACAVYDPRVLLCIGCALDLAQGTEREREMEKPMHNAVACVTAAVQHDVDCVHMPRIKVQDPCTKTTAYKKCSYGEFVHTSTKRHSDCRLYNAIVPIARRCSCFHNVAFYENAAMLSGDVYVPYTSTSFIPQSVKATGTRMAEQYAMILLDMETAAVFYAASFFNVRFSALAVVLDSVADPSPVAFSKIMPKISSILCDMLMKVIEDEEIAEMAFHDHL